MHSVSKEFTFDAAHMLHEHKGLCKNLHGHTYKLIVTLTGELEDDMIIDFSDLKDIVATHVIKKFDHAFLYDKTNEQESEIAEFLFKWDMNMYGMEGRTTCENMAEHIYISLLDYFKDCESISIRLYETPTSYCEYPA